ncbi:MAG: hypothetical protein ACOYM3_23290 [Terrimicrobiaceae bacterium]
MSEGKTPVDAEAKPIELSESRMEKIHVDSLQLLDKIFFYTAKSTYTLTVGKDLHCLLSSTNPESKVGLIILRGGTNEDVTEYTPNRIFVGGRLAYAFDQDDTALVTTSVIESIAYKPCPK